MIYIYTMHRLDECTPNIPTVERSSSESDTSDDFDVDSM